MQNENAKLRAENAALKQALRSVQVRPQAPAVLPTI